MARQPALRTDVPRVPERTIADMAVDETAWTVPWAFVVHKGEGRQLIDDSYGVSVIKDGDKDMKITRTATHFEVDLSESVWKRQN